MHKRACIGLTMTFLNRLSWWNYPRHPIEAPESLSVRHHSVRTLGGEGGECGGFRIEDDIGTSFWCRGSGFARFDHLQLRTSFLCRIGIISLNNCRHRPLRTTYLLLRLSLLAQRRPMQRQVFHLLSFTLYVPSLHIDDEHYLTSQLPISLEQVRHCYPVPHLRSDILGCSFDWRHGHGRICWKSYR